MHTSIPGITRLSPTERLPLTCTRGGICCHGKIVNLNPWELARLASSKQLSPKEFRDHFSQNGGIHLRFNASPDWDGLTECSQYIPDNGCSVYDGRPLVCRLFPLGRLRSGNDCHYIHLGKRFPCLEKCPEVEQLPYRTVEEFLTSQNVNSCETAQDRYLDIMQNIADTAFALLLESGLSASGDRQTLKQWRSLSTSNPAQLTERIGTIWIDHLMVPYIEGNTDDPAAFAGCHLELLDTKVQEAFGQLETLDEFREASVVMIGLALYLGLGLGVNSVELGKHWIATAKKCGAKE